MYHGRVSKPSEKLPSLKVGETAELSRVDRREFIKTTSLAAGALAYGAWIRAVLWKRLLLFIAVFGVAIGLSSLRIISVAWFDESSPRMSSWILHNLGPWTMVALVFALVGAIERLAWRRWAR